jgi:hypothetical protein
MRRRKLLGFAVLAVLAFAAAMVANAYGVTIANVSERAITGKANGTTSLSILETEIVVLCLAATSTGTEVTWKPPAGNTHIDLTGCLITTPVAGKCTGLGEAEGVILGLFGWELVFDTNPEVTLTTGVVFTVLSDIHFVCAGLVLVVVKAGGQVLCLHNNPTEKSKKHEFTCSNNGTKGDPLETHYWPSSTGVNTEKTITELLTSVSGTAFKMSALAGKGIVETTEEISAEQ